MHNIHCNALNFIKLDVKTDYKCISPPYNHDGFFLQNQNNKENILSPISMLALKQTQTVFLFISYIIIYLAFLDIGNYYI